MNCDESRQLLDAHANGELDLVRHVELEAHLKECPECMRLAEGISARQHRGRERGTRISASHEMRDRLRASLRAEAEIAALGEPIPTPPAWRLSQLASIAAFVAVALFAGYAWGGHRARADGLLREAIADHVRSLQAGHLTDVASADRPVKPWFAGKLDFSPPVADLSDAGFPLLGGRLDQIDRHAGAALVYGSRQRAINLFVWPAGGSASAPIGGNQDGFSAVGWVHGGLNFLAVSELPASDLAPFVAEFRKRAQ